MIIVAGCERSTHTNQVAVDPCSLVTQRDVTALFGNPAINMPSARNECLWRYDAPGLSSWSLRVTMDDLDSRKGPVIIVTKSEITYNGKPDPDPPISQRVPLGRYGGFVDASNSEDVAVHWQHGDKYVVHLKMTAAGPSTPKLTSQIESMKQLAQRVETALGS